MRGVDHRLDLLLAQKIGQPVGSTEAADPVGFKSNELCSHQVSTGPSKSTHRGYALHRRGLLREAGDLRPQIRRDGDTDQRKAESDRENYGG